jgi:surface antigen
MPNFESQHLWSVFMRAKSFFCFALLALATFCAATGAALAGSDDDERDHRRSREHKEEFWDGHCKVEREWEDGKYKEERECEGDDHRRHARPAVVVVPAPVIVYPPWVVIESGVPVYRSGQAPGPVAAEARISVAHCNSRAVGQVLGGIAGAAIGYRMGGGGERAIATAGGAVVGVLLGGEIGRQMDASSQACVGHVLEFAPVGQRIEWPSNTAAQYAVVPGRIERRNGRYCRQYDAEVFTGGGWQRTRGTACRRSDGAWIAAR